MTKISVIYGCAEYIVRARDGKRNREVRIPTGRKDANGHVTRRSEFELHNEVRAAAKRLGADSNSTVTP